MAQFNLIHPSTERVCVQPKKKRVAGKGEHTRNTAQLNSRMPFLFRNSETIIAEEKTLVLMYMIDRSTRHASFNFPAPWMISVDRHILEVRSSSSRDGSTRTEQLPSRPSSAPSQSRKKKKRDPPPPCQAQSRSLVTPLASSNKHVNLIYDLDNLTRLSKSAPRILQHFFRG